MKGAIIYISSCREDPEFEDKITDDMYDKAGDLQIYQVLQLPKEMSISPGMRHIGDVGVSGFNFCRQLQMAVEMADADYVISCEADCLYSPDYFTFVPPKLDRVYRNTNNYVMPTRRAFWYVKSSQTAFQVAGRDFLLDRLNYLLEGQPMWNTEMKNFPKEVGKVFLETWDTFKTKYPCFTIKTNKGMRHHSASGTKEVYELPYWGTGKQIREKYL